MNMRNDDYRGFDGNSPEENPRKVRVGPSRFRVVRTLGRPDSRARVPEMLAPTAMTLVLIVVLVRRRMRPVPIRRAGISRAAVLKAMTRER